MKHLSFRKFPGLAMPLILVAATLTLQGPQAMGYGIGFMTKDKTLGHPVHQVVTRAAVEDSGLLQSSGPEASQSKRDDVMAQILEGVVFNDDPDGYSLSGTPLFESGHPEVKFAMLFVRFNGIDEDPEKTNATEQSHFGDFQFMHAMGSGSETDLNLSETREVIRARILGYMRHVWRLYREKDSLENLKHRYSIIKPRTLQAKKLQEAGAIKDFRDADDLVKKYPDDFKGMSSYDTFLWWSMAIFNLKVLTFHASNQDQYIYRAVGTMLHIIQDSYAKGHVVREGWEKDNSGPIIYFQDYSQQHGPAHDAHDKHKGSEVSPTNYHEIPGARMAKLQSTKLLTMLKNNCPWDNKPSDSQMSVANCPTTVEDFLTNDVFAFSNVPVVDQITRSHKSLEKKTSPFHYN